MSNIYISIRCQSTSTQPLPHPTSSQLEKWPSPTPQPTHPVTKPAARSTSGSLVSLLQIMCVVYKNNLLVAIGVLCPDFPPGIETLQVLFSLKPYVSCICQRVYFLPGEHFAKFRMAATSLFLLAIYSQSFKPRLCSLYALGLYYCQSHQQSLLPFLRFPPRLMFEC